VYVGAGGGELTEYPAGSSIGEQDWHILAGFWHPVAFTSEIDASPVAARLLDVDLVVYRTNGGVAVARDLCVHRGSRLSLGWIDDTGDCVVCPIRGAELRPRADRLRPRDGALVLRDRAPRTM
jgi:vanillate O-demethylase monooxygenase subunit